MIDKVIFMLFGQFIWTLLQLIMGNWGWPLPWVMAGAVYYALAWGPAWGLFSGILSGAVLGILYGGGWNYLNIVIFPLLSGACGWWMVRHEEDREWDFWVPGLLIGLTGGIPAAVTRIMDWSVNGRWFPEALYFGGRWLWTLGMALIIYYIVLWCCELVNEYLGLPRFVRLSKVKQVRS